MKINAEGLALLKSFEGCKLTAYKDVRGILTIGYGHTGIDVVPTQTISQKEAENLLANDLDFFERGVTRTCTAPLTENQFSALVCFTYNCGLGALRSSTLLKRLNAGLYKEASLEFLKWGYANKILIPGLLRRRIAEKKLFDKE